MEETLRSIWEATADNAPDSQLPEGDYAADVLVIGAGFTGLSCALQLAKRGASVIVADAVRPGFGASGRNGGQVIPGLKYDPDQLDKIYGEATTEFVGNTAKTAFDLIEEHNIACDVERTGWIQASVKNSHIPTLESRMRQWERRGAAVRMLDATAAQELSGSKRLVGGWLDERAGQLHPLNYARGLARVAQQAGCTLLAPATINSTKRVEGKWQATIKDAPGTVVKCDHIVVATNGYSGDLFPKLRRTVVPANSFQVATQPLSDAQLASVLSKRTPVSDSRRIGNYFRIGPGGRLMIGGRGTFSDPTSPDDFKDLIAQLHAFYPWTKSVPLEFFWYGKVAMTMDHLPHLHQPVENLTMAVGYNGRGVALATSMGKAIADHLFAPTNPLPLRFTDIKPLPFHDMHRAYATMAIWYYRLRDYLEN